MDALRIERSPSALASVEDYQPLVGAEAVERILKKAARPPRLAHRERQLHLLWRRRLRNPVVSYPVDERRRHSHGMEGFWAVLTSSASPRRCITRSRAAKST